MCSKEVEEKCQIHDFGNNFKNTRIDVKHYFEDAKNMLGIADYEVPPLIKGIRGTSSEGHDFEHLSKGFLRAKYNLAVNKDGTVRYDGTEIALTHS